jgi:hypothetical protein
MSSTLVENICLPYLLGAQNDDGGWGFHAKSVSRAEPTAWALIALLESSSAQAHEVAATKAFEFLSSAQLSDGSWPSSPELREGSWVTSIVCTALLGRTEYSQNVARGVEWLCKELPGEARTLHRLVRGVFGSKKAAGQNDSYFGWSWTVGTASWVEPTSQAIIFLRSVPAQILSAPVERRLRLGEDMLFDRMCAAGGWNCGNPLVYGVPGEPQVTSTAWALLALRAHAERPEVQKSLAWLVGTSNAIQSPVSLALAVVALNAYGRDTATLIEALRAMYEKNEILWNVPEVAWAVLALSETQNWLRRKSNGQGD